MEIYQIKYLLAVAEYGSFSRAAEKLYVSQSSISTAVQSLEKEFDIIFFDRTSKGVLITREGEELLADLFNLKKHINILYEEHIEKNIERNKLTISSQHHVGSIDGLLSIMEEIEEPVFFRFFEENTNDIIKNVENGNSDLGIVFINTAKRQLFLKELNKKQIIFKSILSKKAHGYICEKSPLASKDRVYNSDFKDFSFITYDRDVYNTSIYTSIMNTEKNNNIFEINDRSVAYSILKNIDNSFLIGSGIMSKSEIENAIISKEIEDGEIIEIGYILNKNKKRSRMVDLFIENYIHLLYMK